MPFAISKTKTVDPLDQMSGPERLQLALPNRAAPQSASIPPASAP
jgi:hypothetical protein